MNEGTNEERLPDVDVGPNAGIVRSPLDEIKAIQILLADVYKDAGDGRTLFRELVQNADDAGARRLGLTVLERGWSDARNSLLRGPALLVANDGAFPDKDREALHKAIGGSKEDEVSKIGTFGIGLKSVFHICEAFLYMGAEKSEWRAGVLNPWTGTGENRKADPLHPDWNKVDVERLRFVTTELLGETGSGLLLWIPLRRHEHLDRGAEGRRYGLGEHCPTPDDLYAWFGRSAPAALLLAQCGHLRTIDTARAARPESLRERDELREAWRDLCEVLPKAWLVETPVDSRQAVAELAAEDVIGEGLFPVPFGRRRGESPPSPQLDQERLDRALYTLGRRLEAGGESERLRHSRLLLAETLLSRRHDRPMGEHLVGLPLLRAIRLPEDREEAWSIAELRRRLENRRVFASPASEVSDYDGTDGIQPERPSDPKRAVMELAKALHEAVWLVSAEAVASVPADVPSPAPEDLASAVLRAEALADPAHRKPLLMRLAPGASDNANVLWAARVLLAGRAAGVVGEDAELFHDRTGNGRALRILLRLLDRSPSAILSAMSRVSTSERWRARSRGWICRIWCRFSKRFSVFGVGGPTRRRTFACAFARRKSGRTISRSPWSIDTTFSSPGNRNRRTGRMSRGSGCGSSTERFGMQWN